MRRVSVALSLPLYAALEARVELARALCPPGVEVSEGAYLHALLREHLAARRAARHQLAGQLLAKFWPVARAVAAKWFSRMRGEVPLPELDSAAFNEIATAAHRFDPSLGYSPAPYFRRWAEWGIRAHLRQRGADAALIRPDGDQGEEGGSRWERLGARDESLEHSPERAEQRRAVLEFLRHQEPRERRALRRLALGEEDDQVARATGLALEELRLLREALAEAVGVEPDAELSPAEAAAACGVPLKMVKKALAGGQLEGQRRGGAWVLRAADVRAWLRRREAGR